MTKEEFIAQHGLQPYIHTKINLLCETFPQLVSISMELEADPEVEATWHLVFTVRSKADWPDLYTAYHTYLDKWVAACPPGIIHHLSLTYYSTKEEDEMRDYEAELGIDPTGCMVEGNQIVRYSFSLGKATPVAILATYQNKFQALAVFGSWLVHCQGRQGLLGGLLEIAQRKARDIDGSPSPLIPNETRGMGGVSLSWHPYECKWWARADWSDSSKVGFACNDPVQAVQELIRLLDKEQGKEQERKNP